MSDTQRIFAWVIVVVFSLPVVMFAIGVIAAVAERCFGVIALSLERCFEGVVRGMDGFIVALILALKGTTGGLIDLTGSAGYGWDNSPAPVARSKPTSSITHAGYEHFEAYTPCPTCDLINAHRMREPRTVAKGERRKEVLTFTGQVVFQSQPRDESIYDVIRICANCGQEWGQR